TVPSNWTKEVAPGETGEFTVKFNGKGNGNKVSKSVTLTTNTEKGTEVVKITAFVEADPNAAQKAAGTASVTPVSTMQTSTQPGHEGHNHN
ncbi:MAG: DUF1573 domain-containing protein, partial [Bacteroidia bacterium]|nr:DUF1573 domain-containing protein [Bacteroidia bacterium]